MSGDPGDREKVLRGALTFWAALLDGVPAWRVLPPEALDAVLAAVGGWLVNPDGTPQRAEMVRRSLLSWLAPRPGAPAPDPRLEEYGYEVFLVSWGLSIRAGAMAAWRDSNRPRRIDPAVYLARATGWGRDRPAPAPVRDYLYLASPDLSPEGDRGAGRLVEAGVAVLLNAGVRFGEPKNSRFDHRMRRLLTARVSQQLRLFDSAIVDGSATPTTRITRLAYVRAVGLLLGAYAETVFPDEDREVREFCDGVRALWSEPQDLTLLRRHCIDFDILGERYLDEARESLGVEYADFRAVFRTFAEEGADFGGEPAGAVLAGEDLVRRTGVLLELAIADLRDGDRADRAPDLPATVAEQLAVVLDEVDDTLSRQRDTPRMLGLLERLRESTDRDSRVRPGSRATFLEDLLTRLESAGRIGEPVRSSSDTAATPDEIDRLVYSAHSFLDGGRNYGPEQLINEFGDALPAAVRALTAGPVPQGLDHVTPQEARWLLLEASGRAMAQRPDMAAGPVIAGAFADLGWFAANETKPDDIRSVFEPLQTKLRSLAGSQLAYDLVGPITRILRGRPLADNKHDNFDVAQRMAHDAVRYGSMALQEAMRPGSFQTVSRVAAALTGLQLSLLQAGGVFVRSAEAELTFSVVGRSREQQLRHGAYMRDLAATSLTYTNLAVQRLKDIRELEESGLLTEEGINYPITAAATTAAMGMRTLLLWSMLSLAFPNRGERPADIKPLIMATPGQFHDMLRLKNLTRLNFADMTRIAMHYAFLSGDFRHPATGARGCHPDTPEHLRPRASGTLDLAACGRYLMESGFDTGILDVIQIDRVRRALDETSDGRYGEWREKYANPVQRKALKFRRGSVSHIAFAPRFLDPAVEW